MGRLEWINRHNINDRWRVIGQSNFIENITF